MRDSSLDPWCSTLDLGQVYNIMQETLTDDTIVSEKLLPLSWMERCEGGKDDTIISKGGIARKIRARSLTPAPTSAQKRAAERDIEAACHGKVESGRVCFEVSVTPRGESEPEMADATSDPYGEQGPGPWAAARAQSSTPVPSLVPQELLEARVLEGLAELPPAVCARA